MTPTYYRNQLESLVSNNTKSNDSYIFDFQLVDFTNEFIIPNKEKLPRLFRYSPADYYNIRSLETQTVHLSEARKMNDVYEGLTGYVDDNVLDCIDEHSDIVYIKSFSESKNDPLMWATYAENYSGMCVEYDVSKLPEKTLYHLFPVRYSNQRNIKNNLGYAYKQLDEIKYDYKNQVSFEYDCNTDLIGSFLSKSKDWKHEKEWRLAYSYLQLNFSGNFLDVNDDERPLYEMDEDYLLLDKNVPFKCIKTIYLGPRMRTEIKKHIVEINDNIIHANIIELKLDNNEYKLVERL